MEFSFCPSYQSTYYKTFFLVEKNKRDSRNKKHFFILIKILSSFFYLYILLITPTLFFCTMVSLVLTSGPKLYYCYILFVSYLPFQSEKIILGTNSIIQHIFCLSNLISVNIQKNNYFLLINLTYNF